MNWVPSGAFPPSVAAVDPQTGLPLIQRRRFSAGAVSRTVSHCRIS